MTLIEVLIAVTLLSLLSVVILLSMRAGLGAMGKANEKLLENRRVVSVQRILEQQLAGLIPAMADCQVPDGPPARMLFFQGEPRSMRFVSTYSLQEGLRGYPRILEFQVIPGDGGEGVRLVVNEHLYTGALGAGFFCLGPQPDPLTGAPVPVFRPIQVGPASFVLADRLAGCRFLYRERQPPPALYRWVDRWILHFLPEAIRIEMAPLDEDLSKLQPVTLTAPVRILRDAGAPYVDQ